MWISLTKSLSSSVTPNFSRSCSKGESVEVEGEICSAKCLNASDLICSARFDASAAISLERFAVSETRSENLEAPMERSCVRFAVSSARLRALFHKSMP